MTAEDFAAAVAERMRTLADEKESLWKMRGGKALPAAARTLRLEMDAAILTFAKAWEPKND